MLVELIYSVNQAYLQLKCNIYTYFTEKNSAYENALSINDKSVPYTHISNGRIEM